MAGDFVPEEELKLKGIQKYFNSFTLRGRFNFVAATYGTIFGSFLLYKLLTRGSKEGSEPKRPKASFTSNTNPRSNRDGKEKACCCD